MFAESPWEKRTWTQRIDFQYHKFIFLIRFLRFFRIFPTSKFSKYSKDSNLLLITHTYFILISPIPLRYHSEGLPNRYRRDKYESFND